MGNYVFKAPLYPPGTKVVVVRDPFTKDIPDEILGLGKQGIVEYTINMEKSRPNAPDITLSKVVFRDGSSEVYLTKNLKQI